jgi:DNA end-binding protein Ku
MRAMWKGSISFGLVNIPVNAYPAAEDHTLEFHMLHKKDLSPIRFARICKEENKEVTYKDIVKGYEYEKGEFIVVDEEDFKAANAKKTSTIEIQHFTEISSIDPIYYEKPYYLEPDKKSGKAYTLLTEALLKSKKVAVANFVFRNREHIGVILPLREGLLLMQMRYHVEIRPFEKLELPKDKVTAGELKMALTFIDQLTKPFEPEKHHDTYVEELMGVIEQKLKGKKIVHKKEKTEPSYAARDLMHLLQESMKKTIEETNHKKKKIAPAPTSKRTSRKKRSA